MDIDKAIIKQLKELEIRCITGNFDDFDFCLNFQFHQAHSAFELFKVIKLMSNNIINHDYQKILSASLSQFRLSQAAFDSDNPETFQCVFIESDDDKLSSYVKQLLLLFIGISALQQFVRANISGPEVNDVNSYSLYTAVFPGNVFTQEDVLQFLSRNGEFPLANVVQTKLLCLSYLFLSCMVSSQELCLTRKWWLMRCHMLHQLVLPEKIVSLHDQIASLLDDTSKFEWIKQKAYPKAELTFYMECMQMHLYYHEVTPAKKFLTSAQNIVGLDVELSGAYGKRTQFQHKAVAQLLVKLRRDPEKLGKSSLETSNESNFPTDLNLQDDTLLNKVSFIDNEECQVEQLLCEEQLVLLGYCCLVRRGGAFDELLREEVMSYINCVLEQPKTWCIYLKALIMRCKLEKDSSRRMERSLMQLESIIDSIKKDDPVFKVRAPVIYAVAFPMIWTLEKELADMWMSIGATKSALAIYERLQLWQDVVQCYQQLGRTSCAEALLRKQLQLKETPLLWCLLGDILDDPDMYLKADQLSAGTNSRCQRSLAYYNFKRKDFEKSLPFFQRSLEINPLQCGVWFSYGYAALQCKDYHLSARAYRQVVLLDQDNFEAWNNLSNAYIRSQQKERAWRSLQEALKCNYEEWRVWENFLLVSTDIGVFEDMIRAWHRLLDIKGKYQDPEVLGILVRAINEDMLDFYGQSASRLRKSALQLLGRLSSAAPNDYSVWDAYSALLCPDPAHEEDIDVLSRSVLYQQKAVRYCSQVERWESNFDQFKLVLKAAVKLIEMSSACIKRLENASKAQQKSSTKLAVQSIVVKAQKHLDLFESSEKNELEKILEQLKSLLTELLIF